MESHVRNHMERKCDYGMRITVGLSHKIMISPRNSNCRKTMRGFHGRFLEGSWKVLAMFQGHLLALKKRSVLGKKTRKENITGKTGNVGVQKLQKRIGLEISQSKFRKEKFALDQSKYRKPVQKKFRSATGILHGSNKLWQRFIQNFFLKKKNVGYCRKR